MMNEKVVRYLFLSLGIFALAGCASMDTKVDDALMTGRAVSVMAPHIDLQQNGFLPVFLQ